MLSRHHLLVIGININILECKLYISCSFILNQLCININILECKLHIEIFINTFSKCININILECKYIFFACGW